VIWYEQLAMWAGARVIATVSSVAKAEHALAAGGGRDRRGHLRRLELTDELMRVRDAPVHTAALRWGL
jgi:hypothetical protein